MYEETIINFIIFLVFLSWRWGVSAPKTIYTNISFKHEASKKAEWDI